MALSFSLISLLSAIISIFAILTVIYIFKKVYQEDYRKPWLFIGISAVFIASAQILRFLTGFYNFQIINTQINELIILAIDFISISILAYALLLESLILKYYKGKFIKMKFIPVQEGSVGGAIDLNISNANAYLAYKKDKKNLLEQFAIATKKGFEGFLITEENPKEIRTNYKIQLTPIAWINQTEIGKGTEYIQEFLDENSDIVDPLQLNNLIAFIDNFLEQSQNPFIMIDLNLILRTNNFTIVQEFLRYISARIKRYNGILITLINADVINKSGVTELEGFLTHLET